jgi:hypothetical protein
MENIFVYVKNACRWTKTTTSLPLENSNFPNIRPLLFILIANEFMEFPEDSESFRFPETRKSTVSGDVAVTLCAQHIH